MSLTMVYCITESFHLDFLQGCSLWEENIKGIKNQQNFQGTIIHNTLGTHKSI